MVGGAEPVAVVLFSGAEDDLQHTVTEANRELAEYQQIRRVLRWPEIDFPYTSTGKLVRRQVARWASTTLVGQQSAAGGVAADRDALLTMIAEVTGEAIPAVDSGDVEQMRLSEDLHLDSLGRVQLQSTLEQRFGLELEDDAVAKLETVGDLRALVEVAGCRLQDAGSSATEWSGDPSENNSQATTGSEERTSDPIYPRWPWSWPVQAVRVAYLELVLRPVVWLLAAPRVVCEAAELPDGPVLLIANHVTAYDGALILYALPAKLRRRVAVAMSGEMLVDMRHACNQPNTIANFFRAGGVLAADGAVQRLSAAAREGLSAELCARGRGDGPRLLGADLPRRNAQPGWQTARVSTRDRAAGGGVARTDCADGAGRVGGDSCKRRALV